MTPIVGDASALLEYLLRTHRGVTVADRITDPGVALHAPYLCDVEVGAGLRRALIKGAVSQDRAAEATRDYLDLPLKRHPHAHLLPRVLQLRDNFSAYDAMYVALAEELRAEFLTGDEPLARATRVHTTLTVASVS